MKIINKCSSPTNPLPYLSVVVPYEYFGYPVSNAYACKYTIQPHTINPIDDLPVHLNSIEHLTTAACMIANADDIEQFLETNLICQSSEDMNLFNSVNDDVIGYTRTSKTDDFHEFLNTMHELGVDFNGAGSFFSSVDNIVTFTFEIDKITNLDVFADEKLKDLPFIVSYLERNTTDTYSTCRDSVIATIPESAAHYSILYGETTYIELLLEYDSDINDIKKMYSLESRGYCVKFEEIKNRVDMLMLSHPASWDSRRFIVNIGRENNDEVLDVVNNFIEEIAEYVKE